MRPKKTIGAPPRQTPFAALPHCGRRRSMRRVAEEACAGRYSLRRTHAVEEGRDLGFEVLGPGREPLGPAADLADRGGRLAGRLLDRLDFVGGARGVAGRGLDAACDLARGGALLIDRGGDRGRDRGQLMDAAADRTDLVDGALGRLLDRGDLLGYFLSGARGLVGERLDLSGDHRESLASLTGTGRFDRCIQ